ncbi:MAG: tRNA pseudouridine(13) synthase TruD [uncultured DHVE6 group euryarchaeote]|jgi:tRNA pseudouridine13 synthase|nr:MAG: tRNA pseudouridine(13) synthase TruD [uncultured DHVE6 group euryarchaeote]
MKIKQAFEDFVVDEIFDVETKDEGKYAFVLLTKTNWTTQRAIMQIARRLRISKVRVHYAGIKDKRAITSQVISILGVKKEDVEGIVLKDMEFKFLGYSDEDIHIGNLLGNKFKVRVDLTETEKKNIKNNLSLIKKQGFVNYFGPQRFSSGSSSRIGRAIVKGDFEAGVKVMLSDHHGPEGEEFDKFVLNNWENWKDIMKVVPRFLGNEKAVLDYLIRNPTDFAGALRNVAKPLRRIFVHAYQSEIWNRAVSKYIESKVKVKWFDLPGHKIAFPVGEVELENELEIPGYESKLDGEFGKFLSFELKTEEIGLEIFRVQSMPELSSRGATREPFVKVTNLKFDGKEWFEFELEKGAYATVLLDSLVV